MAAETLAHLECLLNGYAADFRVTFGAKDGEFVHLVRGGEAGVFVKMKEDQMSRKEKL